MAGAMIAINSSVVFLNLKLKRKMVNRGQIAHIFIFLGKQ